MATSQDVILFAAICYKIMAPCPSKSPKVYSFDRISIDVNTIHPDGPNVHIVDTDAPRNQI